MRLLTGLLAGILSTATFADDRDELVALTQAFFDAMQARDVERSAELMMPDGQFYAYRETAEGVTYVRRSHQEHLDGLAAGENVLVERFWDPTVLLHGRMAVVWAPYDLYSDGAFVHCGVDSFSFLKSDDGWKIAGIVFSMEPEGCPPSPLGPLDESEGAK